MKFITRKLTRFSEEFFLYWVIKFIGVITILLSTNGEFSLGLTRFISRFSSWAELLYDIVLPSTPRSSAKLSRPNFSIPDYSHVGRLTFSFVSVVPRVYSCNPSSSAVVSSEDHKPWSSSLRIFLHLVPICRHILKMSIYDHIKMELHHIFA